MTTRGRLTIASIACSLLVGFGAIGEARAGEKSSEADTLFTEGRELLEKGRFAEACDKLQRSEQLSPAVGTLLNLGFCFEQVGKPRSAMEAYAEADVLAQGARDEKRAAFARERYAAVAAKVMKLVIRVAKPDVAGLSVTRNGHTVPQTDWGKPIPVDPDDFIVTASAPGRVTWKGVVQGRGDGAVLTVVVPPLEDAKSVAGSSETWIGTRRIAALTLGGAAAASIGAGLALGLAAKGRHGDADSHCDASGCDPVGVDIQRSAVTQGNIATALVGLGLVLTGAGIYLWLSGSDEAPKARTTGLAFAAGRRGIGATFW